MELFKISKGLSANLPLTKTAGSCWYTIDDSLFYIDYEDENGVVQRKALNAKDAEMLSGASLATILNSNSLEIPTSKAVYDAIDRVVSQINDLETRISAKQNIITGTAGQFVVIGNDGIVTTRDIVIAEEVAY